MFIKQLSVFIENRQGRLEKVTETLKNSDINICSLSLADTSEYGLLRMIVSDPDKAKQVLRENGFSAMLTDVIAVKLPHKIGMLQKLLETLSDAGLNIEYMYALSTAGDDSSIVIKTSDGKRALALLKDSDLEIYTPKDAYCINDCN